MAKLQKKIYDLEVYCIIKKVLGNLQNFASSTPTPTTLPSKKEEFMLCLIKCAWSLKA